MFQKQTPVDREIDVLFRKLRGIGPEDEQYPVILDRISMLHKLQVAERQQRVSSDTLVLAGANLLGIVMILKHEELNFITTKALSLIPRIK